MHGCPLKQGWRRTNGSFETLYGINSVANTKLSVFSFNLGKSAVVPFTYRFILSYPNSYFFLNKKLDYWSSSENHETIISSCCNSSCCLLLKLEKNQEKNWKYDLRFIYQEHLKKYKTDWLIIQDIFLLFHWWLPAVFLSKRIVLF